jgi:hypothetical protein
MSAQWGLGHHGGQLPAGVLRDKLIFGLFPKVTARRVEARPTQSSASDFAPHERLK